MKYLKLFENILTESEVDKICKRYNIRNWTLNSDGTVDVNSYVWINKKGIESIPLKFGRVDIYFDLGDNKLSSLEGCPSYVDRDFYCDENNLTSLIGCSQYVGNDFYCQVNNIKNFEGIGYIGRNFNCWGNPIYELWVLFEDVSKIDQFNEWSIIQGDNVILYRLNDFLEEIGKEEVTEEQLERIKKHYNII